MLGFALDMFRGSLLLLSAISVLTVTACGGGGGGGGGGSGIGTLALSLQDAFTDDYQAIYVSIDEVHVHLGGRGNQRNEEQQKRDGSDHCSPQACKNAGDRWVKE